MRLRRPSLRIQLAAIGLLATLLPLLALLGVVFATSEEQSVESLDDDGLAVRVESDVDIVVEPGVPDAVVVAAVALGLFGLVAVWWWSGRAVRPMREITDVVNDIQAGSLDRRLDRRGDAPEVQALADSFDQMLDRLERATTTERALIEDASHELRTPLAALAVNNEVIRRNPSPSPEEYDASIRRDQALIERLQLTIDDLLSGTRRCSREAAQVDNDLMAIARRVADQHRAVNPDMPLIVQGPDELRLGIDGPSVERALVNLVENAARFASEEVVIEVVDGESGVELAVTDDGPGIAADAFDAIFDRYRRGTGGGRAGIGLALVKQVAEAHGSIRVESPPPGRPHGSCFVMTFGADE